MHQNVHHLASSVILSSAVLDGRLEDGQSVMLAVVKDIKLAISYVWEAAKKVIFLILVRMFNSFSFT